MCQQLHASYSVRSALSHAFLACPCSTGAYIGLKGLVFFCVHMPECDLSFKENFEFFIWLEILKHFLYKRKSKRNKEIIYNNCFWDFMNYWMNRKKVTSMMSWRKKKSSQMVKKWWRKGRKKIRFTNFYQEKYNVSAIHWNVLKQTFSVF